MTAVAAAATTGLTCLVVPLLYVFKLLLRQDKKERKLPKHQSRAFIKRVRNSNVFTNREGGARVELIGVPVYCVNISSRFMLRLSLVCPRVLNGCLDGPGEASS